MITPIFNLETAIQAVLYVANRLTRKDFHKIFKILYFADRNHLSNYGRTITGDTYIAMEDGPVPSKIYDMFKIVRGDGLYAAEKAQEFTPYFGVKDGSLLVPKQEANLYYLSESDIKMLDGALEKYGNLSWSEVRELSHDYAWNNTVRNQVIDLQDIMRESGDEEEFIDFVSENIALQKDCL